MAHTWRVTVWGVRGAFPLRGPAAGDALDLLAHSGNLFFNVTEPLAKDETMNICTATMVAGIRGTSGWVEAVDGQETQMCVLDGSVQCTVADPVTGESRDHVNSPPASRRPRL